MLKSYIKIAWRNLRKSKESSLINIIGLALGLATCISIGLWIWDELSYNKYHENYDRIGQIVQTQTLNGELYSDVGTPYRLKEELQKNYREHFKYVVAASWEGSNVISYEDKHLTIPGITMDKDGPEMLSLQIIHGSIKGLEDPNSIMLAESTAKAFFGKQNPVNQVLKMDEQRNLKVTAVYKDLPYNTTFRDLKFIAPWDPNIISIPWLMRWKNASFQMFVQIPENSDFRTVSAAIANAKLNKVPDEEKKFNAQLTVHPMKDWHLRNEWKNGKVVGGFIQYVKLFGLIGVLVLLLACINFMNLSTARSERRAKEVGIRKTVGSPKKLLIAQFLTESVLIALIAFIFSIALVFFALPWFNNLANKQMHLPWNNIWFWCCGLLFALLTGLMAGSYPAFYLSSFNPLRVLKGTFKAGRMAGLSRKILVVVQFTVSIALIIGIGIVFRQIQYTKNRPTGYERDRLMLIEMLTLDFYGKFDVLRSALKEKDAVEEIALSSSPMTDVWHSRDDFDWAGKDPELSPDFAIFWMTHEYGKTINWKIREGRDFSRDFVTDSTAIILNEAAVKFMGLKDPIGKTITWDYTDYHIIGIADDVVMGSPFSPVKQAVYLLDYNEVHWINLRLNAQRSTADCIAAIKEVFKEVAPNAPFVYKFADAEYAAKFAQEERIGELASAFAVLAIIISSLGIFGLASFVTEQRSKEIGIRKIVGASLFQLWRLLSKDFIILVAISGIIATPVAYKILHGWLQKYEYRSNIPWWIFAAAIVGALCITLIIVSLQTIKAAKTNPIKSLRDE